MILKVKGMTNETDYLSRRVRMFDGDNAYTALKSCRDALFEPITMPQAINAPPLTPLYQSIRNHGATTTISLKATGLSKAGNRVVVYAHIADHFFSKPKNILSYTIQNMAEKPGKMPGHTFNSLLTREDNKTVLVIDHKLFFSGKYKFNYTEALKNPRLVAACGGENGIEELFKYTSEVIFHQYCDHEAFRRQYSALWRFIAIGPSYVAETSVNYPHCFIGLETPEANLKSELEEEVLLD